MPRTRYLRALVLLAMSCNNPPADERRDPERAVDEDPARMPTPRRPAGGPTQAAERPSLIETVGDIGLVQLYADDFDELSLEERTLAYHLYRAAIAGDPIAYDQRYRHSLAAKSLIEAILTHSEGIEPALLGKIETYAKQIWIHHGIHHGVTARKIVPPFSFDELVSAARTALENHADFGVAEDGALQARLDLLRRPMFDPGFEPFTVQKSPPSGQDIITGSVNTFYQGVTAADLRSFRDRYPLNSRLSKRNGRLVEEVYRAGGGGAEPGLYADELRRVIVHLRRALPFAGQAQREYLGHLIRYFETGEPQAFRDYNIAWVQDNPKVDAILGFIESYGDARGAKGTWEGVVSFVDQRRTSMMRSLAENARYFEERTPWSSEYRRIEFRPLVANAVVTVGETGDGGPISPVGINLPNEQAIREQHGSRNFLLTNISDAAEAASGSRLTDEFSWSSEDAREIGRCSGRVWAAIVALHEVTGHGSGRVLVQGDPHEHLRQYYSTLEEARADLVALWHLHDPKLVELGVVPDTGCADAGLRFFVQGYLAGLRKIPDGDTIEEDHIRARSLIVGWAMEKGTVVEARRDGHYYLRVTDVRALHAALGELLAELQRIKATGDFAAIEALVERHATRLNTAWRDDAVARASRLGVPRMFAFVSPRLVATADASGRISDVRALAPESFRSLMLEWSRLARE